MLCLSGYSVRRTVLCVAKEGGGTHDDYMKALHQRFFREPDCTEIRRELETLRLTLRDKLDKQDREALLKLADHGHLAREDVSLASFTRRLPAGAGDRRRADALLVRRR